MQTIIHTWVVTSSTPSDNFSPFFSFLVQNAIALHDKVRKEIYTIPHSLTELAEVLIAQVNYTSKERKDENFIDKGK